MSWNNVVPAWTAEEELKWNVDNLPYSSAAIASIVAHLTGGQSTQTDIPFVSSVKHMNIATYLINNQLELERFFNLS